MESKEKEQHVVNMSYESMGLLILEKDRKISFVQGKEWKATVDRKGIS